MKSGYIKFRVLESEKERKVWLKGREWYSLSIAVRCASLEEYSQRRN